MIQPDDAALRAAAGALHRMADRYHDLARGELRAEAERTRDHLDEVARWLRTLLTPEPAPDDEG